MYIRKIARKWKNKDGKVCEKNYYYWYKSIRIGEKVISECLGKATAQEYENLMQERMLAASKDEDIISTRPTIRQIE